MAYVNAYEMVKMSDQLMLVDLDKVPMEVIEVTIPQSRTPRGKTRVGSAITSLFLAVPPPFTCTNAVLAGRGRRARLSPRPGHSGNHT